MRALAALLLVVLSSGCAALTDRSASDANDPAPIAFEAYNETWEFTVPLGGSGSTTEDRPFDVPARYASLVLTAREVEPEAAPPTSSIAVSLIDPQGNMHTRCWTRSIVMSASAEGCTLGSSSADASGIWSVRYEAEGSVRVYVVVVAS